MKKLNIWLVTPFSPLPGEGWGGVKTHAEYLARLLLGLGAELTVILPEGVSRPGRAAAGYTVETVSSRAQPHTSEWASAMRATTERLLSSGVPDIVFSEGYYARGGETALKAAGAPLAVFIHNFHLVHFSKTFAEVDGPATLARYLLLAFPSIAWKMLAVEAPFCRRADLVVSVSGRNADLLRRYYRVSPERLAVMHNWVDVSVFRSSAELREEARRELGLAAEDVCFLGTGALWRPKGFHVAVKAFKLLTAKFPAAVLMLAGEGPEEERLKALAGRTLLDTGKVRFLGKVPLDRIQRTYNAADAFIIPSIHPEGLAYTLIEAMACGLPAIATALGGNIETLAGSGILVRHSRPAEMADAMMELASDKMRRFSVAQACTERARAAFSAAAAENAMKGIIARLAGRTA
jgi:glycosyltransferase involved in cell wall biosynthesis